MRGTFRLGVTHQAHAEQARREAIEVAHQCGLSREESESVAIAVSELATNLVRYAQEGEIEVTEVQRAANRGIRIESRDRGPGIEDVDLAMRDGYSTGGGLGRGLPAARRLLDEFDITSGPDGTRIVAYTWKNGR